MALGDTVMMIHGYAFNNGLSSFYGRRIYEEGEGNGKLLISLDTENGLLELIDGLDGVHIGAYNYIGERKSVLEDGQKIAQHSLKNLPKYLFLYP